MSDIATLLREEGWELPTYNIGEYECKCPYCSHLRKAHHRNNKCAKVWIEDADFATYSCLNCGKHGFVKAQNTDSKKTNRYAKPTIPEKRNLSHADAFLESRGISIATASKMSLYDEKNALGVDLICFPFYKGGQVVNVKRRGIKEKMFFQEKNPEPVVYNYDGAFNALKEHNNTLIICEGEVDCLTFVEAGYDNCVSLPAGSDPQIRDKGYTGSRFDFLKASKPLLDSAQHIILALDADEPGQAMTQSLINMLPHEKLLTVDWSAYSVPGKDANDFWRQDKSIIKDAIDRAQPVEISKITPLIDDPRDLESYLIDGIQGGIQTGFPRLDDFITFLPGDFVSITGYPGCLSGDTIIRINKEKHGKTLTIKNLYKRFNGLDNHYKWSQGTTYIRRLVDDKIKLSAIHAVVYSGKKQVFELLLEDGKRLKATPEHRIMTDRGFVQLQNLKPGDLVMVDNLVKKQGKTKERTNKTYLECIVGKLHPFAKYHKIKQGGKEYDSWRIPLHRLVCEAKMNGLTTEDLKQRTHRDVSGLVFVNPKTHTVHHKDGNYLNNSPDNLVCLTKSEHAIVHDMAKHFEQGRPEYSCVVSITPLGVEDTYDIQCTDIPGNEPNFNANGIIVHNSGKSTWVMGVLLNMARYDNLKCLYCAFENPKKQVAAKLLQMLIGEPVFGAGEDVVKRCQPLYPFLNEHFKVLDDNSEVLKLDVLLNNIKNSIVNDGINVVVIDPFNKIEYARTKDTTGDIGAVLNKLISFTHRHNVLMFLVAHPTKPENRKIGGQDIPTGFDIAGSANFQNMSDAVISVHRKQDADGQKSNTVRVTVTKWRFGERGREGSAYFRYNSRSATYTEATKEEFDAEAKTPRERIELK